MDVIDGAWIKERLPDERGSQVKLARALGLSSAKVSLILSGARRVQPHEIPKVLKFFDAEPDLTPKGFSEPNVSPFTPKKTDLKTLGRLLAPQAQHIATYGMLKDLLWLSLNRGDLLILDLKALPKLEATVIATIQDTDTGSATSHVCKWLSPWLVLDPQHGRSIQLESDGRVAILGVVCAIIRNTENHLEI